MIPNEIATPVQNINNSPSGGEKRLTDATDWGALAGAANGFASVD
jgi:hypothetical protein